MSRISKLPRDRRPRGSLTYQKPRKVIALISVALLTMAALVYVDLKHARDARLPDVYSVQGRLENAA